MPDFNAKMHENRFRLGLRPRPRWGSLQRSPDSLAGFRGPTAKGEGKGGTGGVDPQGFAEMRPLLHVRPEKGEVCFTVSDVGGCTSHPRWGVRRPCLCNGATRLLTDICIRGLIGLLGHQRTNDSLME